MGSEKIENVEDLKKAKRCYEKPALQEFGSLHLTTRGSPGGVNDSGGAMSTGGKS